MKDTGTQYRGPLAGLGAGAAAVLGGCVLLLAVARRQLGEVATVVAWSLMVALAGAALAAAVYVFLWLRYRVAHPELLAPRRRDPQAAVPQAIGAGAEPRAIEPPRVYLNVTPDQLAAILRRAGEEER